MDVYFRTTYDDIAMPDPKAGRLAWLNLDEGFSSTDVGCNVSVVIAEPRPDLLLTTRRHPVKIIPLMPLPAVAQAMEKRLA